MGEKEKRKKNPLIPYADRHTEAVTEVPISPPFREVQSNTYLKFCPFPGNVVKTTNLL